MKGRKDDDIQSAKIFSIEEGSYFHDQLEDLGYKDDEKLKALYYGNEIPFKINVTSVRAIPWINKFV